jgi:hypothetical protein
MSWEFKNHVEEYEVQVVNGRMRMCGMLFDCLIDYRRRMVWVNADAPPEQRIRMAFEAGQTVAASHGRSEGR